MDLTEENERRRREPCLSRDRLFDLASIQRRLEILLGGPLDTEWVLSPEGTLFIVQSRPLALEQKSDTWKALYPGDEVDGSYPVLAEGLDVASAGAASGMPVFINRLSKISGLSAGTVLVVKDTTPNLTGALNKAAAVVAEKGSSTGHLAIIAREFHVPVLVGLPGSAREIILSRPEITIDAYTGRIFAGRAEPLLEMASALKSRENAQELLPARKLLNEVLGYVTPLNLIDPRSPSFRPQSIRTIHDIIRFSHETAINAMFDINDSRQIAKGVVRRLVSNVPLDINIIDIDGGLRETAAVKKVYPEDIISIPMRALYQGMTTDGVRWSGHVPIDFKGFLSVWANTMYDASKYERRLGDRSYAILSGNYLNFASRLGYHFSILDAYAGPVENENYISFRFKGGAASLEKRTRRVRFIQKVLEKHDFWVDQKADLVNARIKRLALAGMEKRLVMLGRLMGCSRQLDVTMHSDVRVDEYVQRFMDGDYSMGHRDPGSEAER